jgi:Tfp pilus assembly protein PilF
VQAEIARAVVAALEVRLLPGASLVVAGHRTTSPEAYEAFLRGTYFWKRRSREGLEKAVAEFERAIRLDPTYAPARVGLASALIVASTWQFLPSGEAYPRARGEVDRAIELDPNLAEAYAARASIEWDTWKFDAVERDFRRAIALDGNLASAHQWFGEFLGQQAGRPEESIREATLAVEIDPLSLIANSSLGWMLMLAGQNEKAIQQLRATLEMEPEFAPARLFLADAYAAAGAFPEADTQLDLAARAGASATDVDGRRAQFAARSGRPEEARRLLRGLEALPSAEADGAVAIAGVYALLGENDATFAWLERAFRARVPSLGHLGSQAAFAKVRSDRRYARLLERIEPP